MQIQDYIPDPNVSPTFVDFGVDPVFGIPLLYILAALAIVALAMGVGLAVLAGQQVARSRSRDRARAEIRP